MTSPSSFTVSGFSVGHWSDRSGATGCTVLLPDERALAVVDVRGGAPGTRELALLEAGRLVQRVDAVLLTGGSAFGLAAADGVMRWLKEQGRGFRTSSIPVPIVPALVLFDLRGDHPVWPDSDVGYLAAASARPDNWRSGRWGAGTGATFGKWRGRQYARPGGLGCAFQDTSLGRVAAMFAVNAVGDIATGEMVETEPAARDQSIGDDLSPGENTTIGVVVIDGAVDRDSLVRCAVAAHDGMARAISPAHTIFDGDAVIVLSRCAGAIDARSSLRLTMAVEQVVGEAIRNGASQPT